MPRNTLAKGELTMKILIIEDEEQNKMVMRDMLGEEFDIHFYDLIEQNLEEVVTFFNENRYNFIITDFDLTGARVDFSGGELIDALLSFSSYTQVILLTAYATNAIQGSSHAIHVTDRPGGKQAEWDKLSLLIRQMITSFETRIGKYENTLSELSKKEKLSKEEQILYAKASNFLYEIGLREKDVINENLKLNTVASNIQKITDALETIEIKLDKIN